MCVCVCLRQCVATNARTAVILGIEAEGVGIGFRHAEGLVTIACRVVTDVDLVLEGTAGVVLDDAEVIVGIVCFGVAHDRLEFRGAALPRLSLPDPLGHAPPLLGFFFGDGRAALFRRTRVDAGELEGVLNGLAFLAGIAAFGNFRVVDDVEERVGCLTVRHPDVDDRNLGAAHATGHEIGFHDTFNVVFAETFGFSERSGVILRIDAGSDARESVFHREAYMSGVLEGNSDRKIGIHGFSLVGHQDGIRKRTTRRRRSGWSLRGGRNGRRVGRRGGRRIRWRHGG